MSDNNFDDDLTGIFDDIKPEDFITSYYETSAVAEQSGRFVGLDAFNAHVDEQLRGLRTAFASSDGQLNPIAVLSNHTSQRVFVPQDDENLGQYLERLKREARAMGANWFFFAKKNVFAVYHDEDDAPRDDVSSDEAMRKAMSAGDPKIGILWYAERREGSETHHRHGVFEIVGNRLINAQEGDSKQTVGVFSLILDAVGH